MKYLFIELRIQDGERQHDHRVIHQTNCENINFAAEMYVAHFWGECERENDFWWFHGEITGKLESVTEITKEEYEFLNLLFIGGLSKFNERQEIKMKNLNPDLSAWRFVEKYYPKYYSSYDIARCDDLKKLLDNDFETGDCADNLLKEKYGKNLLNPQIQIDYDKTHKHVYERAIEAFLKQSDKVTYYLFGEDACKIYEEGGIKAVITNKELNDLTFGQ